MIINESSSVWQEKYRPQTIEDMILPPSVKSKFLGYVKTGMPNVGLWSSDPGLGKTSLANALIKSIGCPTLPINASIERSIDVVRGKIQQFAASTAFDYDYKIVIMDEFDNFTRDGMASFRGFLDDYSENCRFIFTGNNKLNVIEPLLDRLENYDFADFQKNPEDKKVMVKEAYDRLRFILDTEGIEYDTKDVASIVKRYYPRIRSMVVALQAMIQDRRLVLNYEAVDNTAMYERIMSLLSPQSYLSLVASVNDLTQTDAMYSYLYKNAAKYFKEEHYPQVIITLAKYQEMASSVRDKNLNLCACLSELLSFVK